MTKFFVLEGGYIILAGFIMLIVVFVTTRPFMGKNALKKGLFGVGMMVILLISTHYAITMNRMAEVSDAFEKNHPILCESRMQTKVEQFVTIQKSHEWSLREDLFSSPHYERAFYSARCIVQ